MRPFAYDPKLYDWASPTQKRYLDAVKQHGSIRAAARELKVNYSSAYGCMEALMKKAARAGYSPHFGMTHPVPEPFVVKGTSTLYGEDGSVKAQWVKTREDSAKVQDLVREFVAVALEDVKGLSKHVAAPEHSDADLLSVYPIGDPHFGMYAWAEEAGDDFDTAIAEKITKGAIDRLVASAPDSETALILPLGDLMHADDTKNVTPTHGFTLDVDTRHQRVMRVTLRAMKYIIYRALQKHRKVVVRIVQGNHDPHAAFAIALALSEHFSNNDRIEVDLSPIRFWYYRFGKVLIGATHGDTAKGENLLGVMASDKPEDWGQTKFRYWYHGHIHTSTVREFHGVIVESFRTLAPKDAYIAGMGHRAGRDMRLIVHHREHGEIERHRCDVGMIQ